MTEFLFSYYSVRQRGGSCVVLGDLIITMFFSIKPVASSVFKFKTG